MTDACPGSCNTAWRATGQGDPWPGEPVWCHNCAGRILRALRQLPYLAGMLAAITDGHHEQPLNPQRVGAYAASPSQAADDLDELENKLYESERQFRALAGVQGAPRHGYLASPTTEIADFLADNINGVLASAFAQSFGEEILQLHRALSSKTKAGTGRHGKPVPCPRCDLKTLTLTAGDNYIRCVNPECNRRLSLAEYDEYAASIARSCSV